MTQRRVVVPRIVRDDAGRASSVARLLVGLVCIATMHARSLAAQQTDVIRGRVTAADSTPLPDVAVKATSYAGSVVKTTKTDRNGAFTLIFVNGEGDYWLDFTRLGYTPKRFEVKRIGDEAVLLANARLTDASTKLDAVAVLGQRNRSLPSRNANTSDVGGGDRSLTTNPLSIDPSGSLAEMAAAAGLQLIPGLDGATDMYSMLGLSGEQNNTTFEGLSSGVTALPPDMLATTSLRPYPFDPSIGGFSGAQISIRTLPGTNFSRRSMSSTAIMPSLEWASPIAAAQGQKYTNARVGGNAAGPIVRDRAFYNVAYNVGRQFSDLQTLLNTNATGLRAAGIAPDSVARLLTTLETSGVPVDRANPLGAQARDVGQLAGNVDLSPSASGTGSAFTIGWAGSYQRSQPVSRGGLLLATPSHTGGVASWGANVSLGHTAYFGFGVLTKTTLGFAASATNARPNELLPEGSVRVGSSFDDGSSSVKTLSFGGNSSRAALAGRSVQAANELSWYTSDDKHTITLATSAMLDGFRSALSTSELGTFRYNSLADLDAGRPASFTRSLLTAPQTGRQLVGALSLGDAWRPNDGLQIQYGFRVDGNRFLTRPPANDDLLMTFRVENTAVPNRIYFSPRAGMQWYYGHTSKVAYAPGAARPPRAVIHAGAGVFQNIASATLLDGALQSTGLADGARSISCIGAAVPAPNWSAFRTDPASIPTACADGSDGSLGTTSPNVTLFDRAFRQTRSLRAAIDWSGPILDNRFVLGVQSIVSAARGQQGDVDLNFDPTTHFTLANEGGRPVFVDPSSIVAATGAVSAVQSRVTPAYQHVWMERSKLRLASRQLSIDLKPIVANPMLRWEATYTLLDTRETFSGFSSTAFNPLTIEHGPGLMAGRHTVSLAWSTFPIFDVVYVTAVARLTSGARYTPMIASDVNGDGIANDRAFIADPAQTSDTAQASSMRSLLSSTTPSVRRCLERQLNAVAARGSCVAPWTASGGLLVQFNPQKIGLPKRATVILALQNPLALADLALHRGNDLRGWGQNIPPDQNLLFVRGFDPSTKQFKYDVNQRFGSTRPQQSATHALPFVSLGMSIDIGMPRERQLLTDRLDAGRRRSGTRANAATLTAFSTSSIPNPMFFILQQSDSLGLSRAQADSIATLSRMFAKFTDSVWTPVGQYLAALPDDYRTSEAYNRYVAARVRTVNYLLTLVPDAKGVLTPSQRRKLPKQVANFLDERVLKFLRTSTAGDGGTVLFR